MTTLYSFYSQVEIIVVPTRFVLMDSESLIISISNTTCMLCTITIMLKFQLAILYILLQWTNLNNNNIYYPIYIERYEFSGLYTKWAVNLNNVTNM